MNYTKEGHLHDVAAFWDGVLQHNRRIEPHLSEWVKCETCPQPQSDPSRYRLKPEPKLRAWRAVEVPLGKEVRHKGKDIRGMLTGINGGYGAVVGNCSTPKTLLSLLEDWTMADGSPCGVMEEQP
jgi:hypothetical protein